MYTYVMVMFWLGVTLTVIRFFVLALREEWPCMIEETLGMHLCELIVGLGFVIWAGILLFVK